MRGDQCQFGAVAPKSQDRGCPIKKPIGSMSNSIEIRHALSRICEGRNGSCSRPEGGRHTICQGSLTKGTAGYPRELCRAVLRGLSAQLRTHRRLIAGCFGIQAEGPAHDAEPAGTDVFQTEGSVHDAEPVGGEQDVRKHAYGPAQGYSGRYKDDLTGQPLRDDLVKAARAKELELFSSKGVWSKVPRQRAFARPGKPPISVRWVDVNKGDEDEPHYRSRLVARQLRLLTSRASRTSLLLRRWNPSAPLSVWP